MVLPLVRCCVPGSSESEDDVDADAMGISGKLDVCVMRGCWGVLLPPLPLLLPLCDDFLKRFGLSPLEMLRKMLLLPSPLAINRTRKRTAVGRIIIDNLRIFVV